MKKGKFAILITLIFASILSMYAVSGTFAKYTTSGGTTENARVARWNINVDNLDENNQVVKTVDIFKDSYIDANGDTSVTNLGNCKGADDPNCYKLIAPGTKGQYKFKISGTAETDFQVFVEFPQVEDTIGRIRYCWDECDKYYAGTDALERLAINIENSYTNKIYKANQPIDDGEHTIYWEWLYDEDACADADNCDVTDTELGTKAIMNSDEEGYKDQAHVALTAKITVVQIQPS